MAPKMLVPDDLYISEQKMKNLSRLDMFIRDYQVI
jgi:hypothetical protein